MRRIVEPNTDERFLVLGERREPPLHHSSGDGCNGSWDVNYAHCGDINSLLAASRYLLCHATWPTWPWSVICDLDLDFGCWILAQEETRNRGLSGKRGHTVSWVFANIFSLFLISHKIIAEEVVDEKAKHVGDQFGEALCRFVPLCAALCRFVPLCAAL